MAISAELPPLMRASRNSGMKNLFSQRGSACRAENRTKKAEAAEKFEEGCGGEGT